MSTLKQGLAGKSPEFWERLKRRFPFQRKVLPPEISPVQLMDILVLKRIKASLTTTDLTSAPLSYQSPLSDRRERFNAQVHAAVFDSFKGISKDFHKLHPGDVVEILLTALFSTIPDVRTQSMELLLKEPKDFTDVWARSCCTIHALPKKSLVKLVSMVFDKVLNRIELLDSKDLDVFLKIIDFTDLYLGGISNSDRLQMKATSILEEASIRGLLENYDYVRAVVIEKREKILENALILPRPLPVSRSIVEAMKYCNPEAIIRLTGIALRKYDDPIMQRLAIENLVTLEANEELANILTDLNKQNDTCADPNSANKLRGKNQQLEGILFAVAKKSFFSGRVESISVALQIIQLLKPERVAEFMLGAVTSKNPDAAISALEMIPSVKKFDEVSPAILVGLVDMAASSKHAGIIWPAASMLSRLPKEHQTTKRWNVVVELMENELGCRFEPGRILKSAEVFNAIPKKYMAKHLLGLVFKNIINDVQVSGAAKRHLEPETWEPYYDVLLLFPKKQVAKTLQEILAQLKNETVAEKSSFAMPTLKKEMKRQRHVGSDLAVSLFLANCIQMFPEKLASRTMWNDSSEIVKAVIRRRDCRKQVSEEYLKSIFPESYHQGLIASLNREEQARGILSFAADVLRKILPG